MIQLIVILLLIVGVIVGVIVADHKGPVCRIGGLAMIAAAVWLLFARY